MSRLRCFAKCRCRLLLPALLLLLAACDNAQRPAAPANGGDVYDHVDSVYLLSDTLFVESRMLDTVIAERGIFSFLAYDYPASLPDDLIRLAKLAVSVDQQFGPVAATPLYRQLIAYRSPYETDFSDAGLAHNYYASKAILNSYAYERLLLPDSARWILKPHLAYAHEVHLPRITERYIRNCIAAYGRPAVLREMRKAKQLPVNLADKYGYTAWAISVFGANVGIGAYDKKERPGEPEIDRALAGLEWYRELSHKDEPLNRPAEAR